jgi:hypothetical protein
MDYPLAEECRSDHGAAATRRSLVGESDRAPRRCSDPIGTLATSPKQSLLTTWAEGQSDRADNRCETLETGRIQSGALEKRALSYTGKHEPGYQDPRHETARFLPRRREVWFPTGPKRNGYASVLLLPLSSVALHPAPPWNLCCSIQDELMMYDSSAWGGVVRKRFASLRQHLWNKAMKLAFIFCPAPTTTKVFRGRGPDRIGIIAPRAPSQTSIELCSSSELSRRHAEVPLERDPKMRRGAKARVASSHGDPIAVRKHSRRYCHSRPM